MSLTIGDTAPDFTAETSEGSVSFHDWLGDSWGVLFSHPKDFTPICTTELGYMAKIKPEFDKRGVKIMALSVDPVEKHASWAADIEKSQGAAPNYPMIGDADFTVSKAYGMLGADVSGDPSDRTAADNQTVRGVFVIGPQLRRDPPGDRLPPAHGQEQSRHPGQLEAGRRRRHCQLGQ
jgi:thioredoxin-dependent peroxiredoxin